MQTVFRVYWVFLVILIADNAFAESFAGFAGDGSNPRVGSSRRYAPVAKPALASDAALSAHENAVIHWRERKAKAQLELDHWLQDAKPAVPAEMEARLTQAEQEKTLALDDLRARRKQAKSYAASSARVSDLRLQKAEKEYLAAKRAISQWEKVQSQHSPRTVDLVLADKSYFATLPAGLQDELRAVGEEPVAEVAQVQPSVSPLAPLPDELVGEACRAGAISKSDIFVGCRFSPDGRPWRLGLKAGHFFDVRSDGSGFKIFFQSIKDRKGHLTRVVACRSSAVPCTRPVDSHTEEAMTRYFAGAQPKLDKKIAALKKKGLRDPELEKQVREMVLWLAFHEPSESFYEEFASRKASPYVTTH